MSGHSVSICSLRQSPLVFVSVFQIECCSILLLIAIMYVSGADEVINTEKMIIFKRKISEMFELIDEEISKDCPRVILQKT